MTKRPHDEDDKYESVLHLQIDKKPRIEEIYLLKKSDGN